MSAAADGIAAMRRRDLLGAAAVLGAAGLAGIVPRLVGDGPGPVVIFDSARPASRLMALAGLAGRRIDLAIESQTNWRALRALGRGVTVHGYTDWAAYVMARLCLEAQGLRVRDEHLDRARGLVVWRMR